MKQRTNTYRNHFSRSYENRSSFSSMEYFFIVGAFESFLFFLNANPTPSSKGKSKTLLGLAKTILISRRFTKSSTCTLSLLIFTNFHIFLSVYCLFGLFEKGTSFAKFTTISKDDPK